MDKKVSCLQINLRCSKAASVELKKKENEIVFITEPYTGARKKVLMLDDQHVVVVADGGPHRPRAALRVRKDLSPWPVPEFTNQDICVAAIKIENKLTYLCSLYLDIEMEVCNQTFLKLIASCQKEKIPLVIGMDSNSHSPLWGSSDRNSRGEELEGIFLTKNLTVLNVGSDPTFETSRASSVIDVTCANSWAMQSLNICDWFVSPEASLSDHKYISFELGKYIPAEEKFQNLRRADWLLFQSLLEDINPPRIEEDGSNLDEAADFVEQQVRQALDVASPLRPAVRQSPVPWWTGELDQIRDELKKLSMKRRRSLEDEEAYRCLRKVYTKRITKNKRESWRDFCKKAETTREISKIIKILRPKPARGISLFKTQDSTLTPRATLENLMDTHFIDSVKDEDWVEAVFTGTEELDSNDVIDYIDHIKVKEALLSFGPHKAAGPDGFKPLVLQKLPEKIINYITKMYSMVVRTSYVPRVWRLMRVIFIPKEGKSDYGNAKSYRPITLSNFLLKGLERLLQWYINDKIIKTPLYAQHAYSVGKSCDTAISDVVDFLEKNTLRGQHVLAVSLDCSGAFDRIKFDSADEAMREMQIPRCIRKLYLNLLKNRKVRADLQGEEVTRIPKRGSPQGGVLSPLVWILIMNLLLPRFKTGPIKIVGYADDIILLVAGKHPPTLVDLMNRALKTVLTWGETHGLVFNPSKTQAVHFSQARKLTDWRRKLTMNGTEIEFDTEMKYLGVVLNRFLLWRPHVMERMKKAIKTMNLANAAIGQKWGFSPKKALWVYTAMARTVLTYGSIVWANNTTKSIRIEMHKLQRRAMLSMTSSMRSTPTAGMEAVLGLLPLDLHAEETAVKTRLRTRDLLNVSWDGIGKTRRGHQRILDDTLDKIPSSKLPVDVMTKQLQWLRLDDINDEDTDITLYTDGSRLEEKSGAGWAAVHKDTVLAEESVFLGKDASVFQSEVVAIERAVRWATDNLESGTKTLIRSDSQAAIMALEKTATTSKVVDSCKKVLKKAKENLRIGIRWIKGHADNTGNELADLLARTGSSLNVASVPPEIPVPLSNIYCEVKDHFLAKWQKRWQTLDECRQTKIFCPRVTSGNIDKLSTLERPKLNLLVQVCTGHALVSHHISKWTGEEVPCEMCLEDDETTSHLYFECPALWELRSDINSSDLEVQQKIILFFSDDRLADLFNRRSRDCASNRLF